MVVIVMVSLLWATSLFAMDKAQKEATLHIHQRYLGITKTGMEIGQLLVEEKAVSENNSVLCAYKELYQTLSNSEKDFSKEFKNQAKTWYEEAFKTSEAQKSYTTACAMKNDEGWGEFRKKVLHALADKMESFKLIKPRRSSDGSEKGWREFYDMNKEVDTKEGKEIMIVGTLAMMELSKKIEGYKWLQQSGAYETAF